MKKGDLTKLLGDVERTNRGLASLLGEAIPSAVNTTDIHIDQIEPNPHQARKHFSLDGLNELSESIKKYGIIQPLILNKRTGTKYLIVAGERRWRAAHMAGLIHIPAVIKNYSTQEIITISLLENIQRCDINPIEEAEGYGRLIEEFGYKQEELADVLGKSRSHVANVLRLRVLSPYVKDKLMSGAISIGHAKLLVGADNCEHIVDVVIKKELSVKQTVKLIKKGVNKKVAGSNTRTKYVEDSFDGIVQDLKEYLGTDVKIQLNSNDKNEGRLIIHFENMGILDGVLEKLYK